MKKYIGTLHWSCIPITDEQAEVDLKVDHEHWSHYGMRCSKHRKYVMYTSRIKQVLSCTHNSIRYAKKKHYPPGNHHASHL